MMNNWTPLTDIYIILLIALVFSVAAYIMYRHDERKDNFNDPYSLFCDDCIAHGHEAGTRDCPQEML